MHLINEMTATVEFHNIYISQRVTHNQIPTPILKHEMFSINNKPNIVGHSDEIFYEQ